MSDTQHPAIALAGLLVTLQTRLASIKAEDDDFDPEPERATIRKTLAAVMDYLRDTGMELELRAPLLHLYAALEDVSLGRENKLFKPATMVPGTPKKKSLDSDRQTMAAAAVTILKDGGSSVDEALSYVASKLDLDKKELANYRKNLTGKKLLVKATDSYAGWLHDRKTYPNRTAKEHVAIMMRTGRKIA